VEMLEHHREMVAGEFPIHTPQRSWERARALCVEWLESETAILLIARGAGSSEPLGYIACRLIGGGPTFDLGSLRGEVDTLVVHDHARGQGVGTALLDAIRKSLVERGIVYWSIGVLAHNPRAAKLYQRVGFRPFTQELLAVTDRQV
jgi:ribosomal protein S18 acetylase RimI-like enzyme